MKAIIFDCFGVLVGTGFWAVYQSLGGDLVKDEEFIDECLKKADLGSISSMELSMTMSKRLKIPLATYDAAFKSDEIPNEEMFDFIRSELSPKYKLALVSNATGYSVRSKIPTHNLELFDEVFISEEVGLLKPDSKLFELALDKLGVKPEETVFVDDHEKYIQGADALGIHTILFVGIDDLKTKLANLEV